MTATLWMDIQRRFLVIERVDRGTPSGAREVSFVLATSELAQIEVPDLDDPDDTDKELDPDLYTDDPSPPEFGEETQPIIKEDPWSTVAAGFGLPGGGFGGGSSNLPWDGGALLPDCCEEPPISVTEVGEPPVVDPPGEVVAWTAGIVVFGGRIWDEFAEYLETDGLSREVREEDGSYFNDWVYVESPWTRPVIGIITTVGFGGAPTPSSADTIWTLQHTEDKAGFTVSVFTAPLPADFGYEVITLSPEPGVFGSYRFDTAYATGNVVQVVSENTDTEANSLAAEVAPLGNSTNIVYSVLFRVNMAYLGSHPAAWANGLKPTGGASGMVTQNSNDVIPLQVMTLDSAYGVGDDRVDVSWEWDGESADAVAIMLELEQ